MTRKLLDTIELTTGNTVEYSVIWMHGLGASGHDFEPIVPELHLLKRPGVRFLFPHAPVRPITVNGGASMRGWYDITSLEFSDRTQDVAGITESREAINDLIANEISKGIPASNIILAGFSQGGAIALYTGMTYPEKLGGIVALSTYFPMQETAQQTLTDAQKTIPVFMAHGQADDVINLRYAEQSHEFMKENGINVEWHTFPIGHSVSSDEINKIEVWFKLLFGM